VGKIDSELSLLSEKVKSLSIAVKDEKLKVMIKKIKYYINAHWQTLKYCHQMFNIRLKRS
jgi:hypothetical protein